MINLISDTVTKPTAAMLEAMAKAEVGDDVFKSDPTVNRLQKMVAEMFGKEDALFCPSGTMTNQIAIKCHTQPLDEMICDITSHVYQYETGGHAFNSGISANLIHGSNGKITAEQIAAAVKPNQDWLPNSSLVVVENSCNKGGGSYYTMDEINPISALCAEKGLSLHLDGARLFNVLVKTGENTQEIGRKFDSISICMSKGLGAPVGSLLIGSRDMIKKARRYRKVMGGGMRQVGYLAAACIYALEHNINRLKEDNRKAKELGDLLTVQSWVKHVHPVHTNIVIFELSDGLTADAVITELQTHQVLGSAFGPNTIRLVTHMDYTGAMHKKTLSTLKNITF